MTSPRLLQIYLTDGTLEGIRIIDPEGDIEAYVIPRLKLGDAKKEPKLTQPSLYILLNADDNRAYIGESENFLVRVGRHLAGKEWWTLAVAVVSKNNDLEKGDIRYLESLTIDRVRSSVRLENNTIPPRNNIQRYKVHKLERILEDTQLVLTSLGYDILSTLDETQDNGQIWYCKTKLTDVRALYRGDQFIVLAGSMIDKSHAPNFASQHPYQVIEREELFREKSIDYGNYVELAENITFKSPNYTGRIVTGRSINAWTTWRNSKGQTMDEIMRRDEGRMR